MAGLCAALRCSSLGLPVLILEQAPHIGGKIMQHRIGPRAIDVGPTVLTMRWVFEELFAACGLTFSDYVATAPMALLARHFWPDGAQLDLHQDLEASAAEIGTFAGIDAMRGYREFCGYAQQLYEASREPFIRNSKPSLRSLWQNNSLADLGSLARIDALVTMHSRLQRFFKHPRLLQLFGRYATYCGGSPYQTPATLNLISHVERQGVWRVKGGMGSLARGIASAAQSLGAQVFCNSHVTEVIQHQGAAVGVRLADGTQVDARAVILNAGAQALPSLLSLRPKPRSLGRARSAVALSAVTCAWLAEPEGVQLAHHNVFFSDDYAAEFTDIFKARRLPQNPTIYVCAADRHDTDTMAGPAHERIFALINAPTGSKDASLCSEKILSCLATRGLRLTPSHPASLTLPTDFAKRFDHTDGALYGDAPHSWRAFFQRAGNRTTVPGLYLCGGSVHPGPGLPMTALSGQQAARALDEDFGLTSRSPPVAIAGGTSTPRATTGPKPSAPSSS